MSFLSRIFSRRRSPFDVAGKQLVVFYNAYLTLAEPAELEDEKHVVARLVFLLGALDCASQAHKMSDGDFGRLLKLVLDFLEVPPLYTSILVETFINLNSSPVLQNHVIQGGRYFSQWQRGDSTAAMTAAGLIRKAVEDPSFPKSPGQLCLMFRPDGKRG